MIELVREISENWFGDADFFRFQHPEFAWLLVLPFLYLLAFLWVRSRQSEEIEEDVLAKHHSVILPNRRKGRSWVSLLLVVDAMLCFVFALMNPQFGSKKEEVMQKGIQVVFALDVSGSMLAEDIKPNRIDRAKHAISKIIDRLGSDRIAIVVFSGAAYLQLPLTNDHAAAKMYLEEIEANMLPAKGTSVAQAIERSISALPKDKYEGSAIVLITDGENHESDAVALAEECGKKGLPIYCLGIGTAEGSTIPDLVGGRKVGLKKDKAGSTVVTRLNEELLAEIAQKSGGQYVRSGTGSLGLGELYGMIRGVDQQAYGSKVFTLYESRFPFFLGLGVLLIVLDFLLFNHKMFWRNEI